MNFVGVWLLAAVFARPLERVATMDPVRAQSAYDARAIQLVYETPLAIDYAARPYRLVAGCCHLPAVSADGRVYAFRMTDVTPLTADDVVRALSRVRDPAEASPGAWTLAAVETLRVTSPRTFEIQLKSPNPVFLWMMAMDYAAVPAADGTGTGPYRLVSWRKNHAMTFERNPAWRAALSEAPGEPFETIRYYVVDDPSTQWLMFLRGEIDFLGSISRDNWDAITDGRGGLKAEYAARGMRLMVAPTLDVFYFGINMRDPVLGTNRKLRQALNCAFDFPAWRKFYNDRVEIADGPVPHGVPGRLEEPFAYAYDLEKARKLLAEAGYPEGLDPGTGRRLVLTLDIGRPSQDSREAGELAAGFYEKLGIRLELNFRTWEAFLSAVNEGRVQLYYMGWVGDYPDAENFLQLFHSKNVSPGPNHSNYTNAVFDAAFDAARTARDEATREALWRTCQQIIREDCPWVFVHFPRAYSLIGPRVENYRPSAFPYGEERHLRVKSVSEK